MMRTVLAFLLTAVLAPSWAAELTTASLAETVKAMKESLKEITPDTAKEFIKTYADPADLEKLTKDKDGGLDAIAKQFASGKSEGLLKVLNAIDMKDGKIDAEAKTISFVNTVGPQGKITFVLIDGKFYIKNH